MIACKTLVRTSLCCVEFRIRIHTRRASSSLSLSSHCRSFSSPISPRNLSFSPLLSPNPGFRHRQRRFPSRCYACVEETADAEDELLAEESNGANVRELLSDRDDVSRLMKMERRTEAESGGRWFPYLDRFRSGNTYLSSGEVLEAIDPYIMEVRKERFRDVVKNRSYSVCLVVEGLCDFGNVSAAFRSADALGFQSVHVVSSDGSKRCNDV